LPGDEHGHDNGFAASSRHFAGNAVKSRVGIGVRSLDLVFKPGVALLLRHFGQIDEGFDGFDLAEEKTVLTLEARPVLEKLRGHARDSEVAVLTPLLHPAADLIDELVFFNAILCPFGIKLKLFAFLLGRGNRDEIGTGAPLGNDLIRNPLVGEPEMPFRLLEWRVNDRIFNDDLFHG
jgi:hypothetical protein